MLSENLPFSFTQKDMQNIYNFGLFVIYPVISTVCYRLLILISLLLAIDSTN